VTGQQDAGPGDAEGRMFESIWGLLLDAADVTATVTVLVALWEGRIGYGSERLFDWLGVRGGRRDCDVDDFLREVRRRSWPRHAGHRLWSLHDDVPSSSPHRAPACRRS
jgi:hypothetical protein